MLIAMGFIETEPQINADERRLITSGYRKGRKDRKAQQQFVFHYICPHVVKDL